MGTGLWLFLQVVMAVDGGDHAEASTARRQHYEVIWEVFAESI